jgi:hypothetical protein
MLNEWKRFCFRISSFTFFVCLADPSSSGLPKESAGAAIARLPTGWLLFFLFTFCLDTKSNKSR